MELATGRQGKPHITSQQDRQTHQGIFGDGAYILNTGSMLEPEVQSSNKIHIKDGALMFQGALFTVKVGTYDEVTINNGNQGMKRKDLIVARYTYNSSDNIETGEWAVIQGTPAADNPVVPEATSGDIQAGDSVVECPVFVVNLDGINVTGVDVIPEMAKDMSTLNAYLAELSGNLYEDLTQYYTVNWAWEFDRLEVIRTGRLVHIAFICHPKDSWSADQIYTVFTSKIPNKYKPRDLIYSLGVKMNGDATDVNNCAFIANPNGSIQIAVGDKVTSGYFLCDMTYACVWDS